MAVATNPDGADTNDGVDWQPVPTKSISSGTLIASNPIKLQYPLDMSSKQDCIAFQVLELVKTNELSTKGSFSPENIKLNVDEKTEDSYKQVQGTPTVFLPIQSGITDINTVSWGSGTLNAVEKELVQLSLDAMTAADPGGAVVGKLKEAYRKLSGEAGDAFRVYLAQLATGTQGLLPRVTGQVLNPNLELLFRGPELRPFQFQFQLSPRSEKEATEVRRIINFFKRNMAVRRSDSSLFLKAPYVFRIKYQRSKVLFEDETIQAAAPGTLDDHLSIGLIKECALKSFSVDYTPLGSYATYDDSASSMVSYRISMDFQEIVPLYDDDYLPLDTENALSFNTSEAVQIGY